MRTILTKNDQFEVGGRDGQIFFTKYGAKSDGFFQFHAAFGNQSKMELIFFITFQSF